MLIGPRFTPPGSKPSPNVNVPTLMELDVVKSRPVRSVAEYSALMAVFLTLHAVVPDNTAIDPFVIGDPLMLKLPAESVTPVPTVTPADVCSATTIPESGSPYSDDCPMPVASVM